MLYFCVCNYDIDIEIISCHVLITTFVALYCLMLLIKNLII